MLGLLSSDFAQLNLFKKVYYSDVSAIKMFAKRIPIVLGGKRKIKIKSPHTLKLPIL